MADVTIKIIIINFNHKTSVQRDVCEFPMLPLIFKLPTLAFYIEKGKLVVRYRFSHLRLSSTDSFYNKYM